MGAVTVAICAGMMSSPGIRNWCISVVHARSNVVFYCTFIPSIISLCCLRCQKNIFPNNFILLGVFTVAMACNVGFICSIYAAMGLGILIAEAFGLTAVIFFSLTAYACLSGRNFSWMGGFLTSALCLLVIVGFVAMFIPQLRNNIIFPLIGALIFSAFILYDTW